MTATVASDLHRFLDSFPQALSAKAREELRGECQRLLADLQHASDHRVQSARGRWSQLLADLHTSLEGPKAAALARRDELARAYEEWARTHDTGVRPPSLKPLMRARTLFHIAMALVAFVCYQFLMTRAQCTWLLVTLLLIFGTLEVTRRFSPRFNHFLVTSVFRPIARPEEYFRVNSATYYLIALLMVTPFFSREAVLVGVLTLGFADPAAAWLGKKFGKRKLYGRKSYVGTAAFFSTSLVLSFVYLTAFAQVPLAARIGAAAAAAILGAAAELFAKRLDDNLTIPLAAVLGATLFLA